jgi:hypothetical protein
MEHAEHPNSADHDFLEHLLNLDDRTLRLMILAEITMRARLDLRNSVAGIFGGTWEFKIVQALLTHGAMNKRQLAYTLFPRIADPHSKLSRKGRVKEAFDRLLARDVLVESSQARRYDVSPGFRKVVELLTVKGQEC